MSNKPSAVKGKAKTPKGAGKGGGSAAAPTAASTPTTVRRPKGGTKGAGTDAPPPLLGGTAENPPGTAGDHVAAGTPPTTDPPAGEASAVAVQVDADGNAVAPPPAATEPPPLEVGQEVTVDLGEGITVTGRLVKESEDGTFIVEWVDSFGTTVVDAFGRNRLTSNAAPTPPPQEEEEDPFEADMRLAAKVEIPAEKLAEIRGLWAGDRQIAAVRCFRAALGRTRDMGEDLAAVAEIVNSAPAPTGFALPEIPPQEGGPPVGEPGDEVARMFNEANVPLPRAPTEARRKPRPTPAQTFARSGREVIDRKTGEVKVALNDHELLARGRESALLDKAIAGEKDAQASQKRQMREKLAAMENRRTVLSAAITDGEEIRDATVLVEADFDLGIVREILEEDGRVIKERKMTVAESQRSLFPPAIAVRPAVAAPVAEIAVPPAEASAPIPDTSASSSETAVEAVATAPEGKLAGSEATNGHLQTDARVSYEIGGPSRAESDDEEDDDEENAEEDDDEDGEPEED